MNDTLMLSYEDVQQRTQLWNDTYAYLRGFFDAHGYTEVRVPLIVQYPGQEPNLDPVGVDIRVVGRKEPVHAGLITSPEYSMKKLLGVGMERIYTLTPSFRNVEPMGARWSVEFTMMEWYRQGADYHACMEETEEMVNAFLGLQGAWPRISQVDALAAWTGTRGASDEDTFNQFILPEVIATHSRFFVTEFPPEQASLARKSPDGRYAERFEGYVRGFEICNGFTELVDPAEQRARFVIEQEARRTAGKEVFPIDEELLFRLSSVASPTFGNALGVDRLVMLKAGTKDIDSIHLFPPSERFH